MARDSNAFYRALERRSVASMPAWRSVDCTNASGMGRALRLVE